MVTGGSSGIGAAIVRRLANHGLKVVACGRQLDRIQVNEHLTYSITCKPQLNMGQYSMGHRSSGSSNPHVLKYRQSFVIVLMYCFCLQAEKLMYCGNAGGFDLEIKAPPDLSFRPFVEFAQKPDTSGWIYRQPIVPHSAHNSAVSYIMVFWIPCLYRGLQNLV